MPYIIRAATRAELNIAIDWAAAEGWNPGLHDGDSFYAADPAGFFIGLLDGEPIATISAVAYGSTFGFVGFYIVKPEYRGRGFGLKLWNQALTHLPVQNVGLDGVLAQQKNYEKSGFRLAYKNVRYAGSGAGGIGAGAAPSGVVPLADVPFEVLQHYDAQLFPAARSAFLQSWIHQPHSLAIGVLEEGRLAGYGVARACRLGIKAGPLFADTAAIAETIFQQMRVFAGAATPLYLDVPEVNPAAIALARRHEMNPVFETVRMYTKAAPVTPIEKVFGVTTFELG